MVQMATPWKHPKTGIYYLYRQIPAALRPEFGGKVHHKESLRTHEPVEAARRFVAANARLQVLLDQAAGRVAAAALKDEISAERAVATVERFLVRHARGSFAACPSLALTWWIEDTANRMFGTGVGAIPPAPSESDFAERMVGLRHERLVGEGWLAALMDLPRSKWMGAVDMALVPLIESADPPIMRTPANEATLMDAWNARVRADVSRLRERVEAPQNDATRTRERPDLRLRELLELWRVAQQPRPQYVLEAKASVEDLIAYAGDLPVVAITNTIVMNYRDQAKSLPAGMPRADRGLPFPQRVEKHAGTTAKKVSATTLKKRIGAIQVIMTFAYNEKIIPDQIARGIRINGYSKTGRKRRPFLDDELKALFESDLFLRPDRLLDRRNTVSDVTLYWLFVLACTSGARLEEVGQARVLDIRTDGGVRYIDITDIEPEGVDDDDALEDKKIKNEGSRRNVPIHPIAEALGFERYVQAVARHGRDALFPDLRANSVGKVTKEASRLANRYIDKVATTDRRAVFHSLRHTFKDEGRNAKVDKSILDQICGHAPLTAGDRYGIGAKLRVLKSSLRRLRFAMVDWSRLTAASEKIDWETVVADVVRRSGRTG